MTVTKRYLAFGCGFSGLGDGSQIECAGKPAAIRAGLAVDQQRLFGVRHEGDEFFGWCCHVNRLAVADVSCCL